MSAAPAYRFESAAQWQCCLSAGMANAQLLDAASGEVVAGFADRPDLLVISAAGDRFWVEGGRLTSGDCAGPVIGAAVRIVIGADMLWVLTPGALLTIDRRSLQILGSVAAEGVDDIAADGRGGLWLAMAAGPHRWREGQVVPAAEAGAFGSCRIAAIGDVPVLLRSATDELLLFDADGSAMRVLALRTMMDAQGRWFRADEIMAAGAALLLSGLWMDARGGREAGFLIVDADGEAIVIGHWYDAGPVRVIAAGDALMALFEEAGGFVLRAFTGVIVSGGTRWLTPVLETERLSGGWLGADVGAVLPEGATLAMRWSVSKDDSRGGETRAIMADAALTQAERIRRIRRRLDGHWSRGIVYAGLAREGVAPVERFAFPLHAAAGPLLWIELTLVPNMARARPRVETLVVRHGARSLMDDLPAIYRGPGGAGDGTMAALVGVLEATTQAIDRGIGALGDRIDPERTEDRWLGSLAAMLGLPFHDALSPAMQRGIVTRAPDLLQGRGTRAGLVALMAAIFPDRVVGVTDRTEALAPMTLGGGGFAGSRLPAMLSGPSRRVPRLNARLVLGRTALCPTDACDPASVTASPEVLVTIPATARERRLYAEPIRGMIAAMVPAAVRVRIRWMPRGDAASAAPDILSAPFSPRPLRLGGGQALGAAQVGGRRVPRLDDGGVPIGHRLL